MKTTSLLFVYLLCGSLTYAQDGVVGDVVRQLAESRTKFPGMRPQIFFSQDKYSPGDTAFFRLFILTEDERILAEQSLMTLELVNLKGAVILQQNVSCVAYGAANQVLLPDDLPPGNYEVRIYSNEMTVTYGLTLSLLIVGEKSMEPVRPTESVITTFPEGGHLVLGSVNRLIVRVTGSLAGESFLRSTKAKIAPVSFDQDGFSSVQFVPQAGESYWVESTIHGNPYSVEVAPPKPEDISLRVYPGPRKTWILDVLAPPEPPRERIFLLLIAQRQILHEQEVYINGTGKTQIMAASDFFPEGYSELFLLDANHQVRAYRPVYEKRRNPATMQFSDVPEVTGQRQNVKATVKIIDGSGNPVKGAFAISVIPESTRIMPMVTPDPSIVLHGNPPYLPPNRTKERIELELMTRPIPTAVVPDYLPLLHRSNLTLSGRAYYRDSTASLPLQSRMVIYLHKDLIRYDTEMNERGNFTFSKIYPFFGTDRIYYKGVSLNKDLPQLMVDWTVSSSTMPVSGNLAPYVEVDRPDEYGMLRKQKRQIEKSYGFFLNPKGQSEEAENPNAVLEDEFQDADITIYPKDYTPFDTMQELILEVIPSLEFRKRQRESTLHVTLLTHSIFVAQRYADGNPLCVVDGCMTSDVNYVMSLSPREILSFKIINEIGKLDKLGLLARNGVVFIQTETPERTRRDLAASMHDVVGISPTFIHTSRYPALPRVPDLRTLLYWNPLVRSDSTGVLSIDYRTSDIPGNYFIRVMGASDTGHIVSGEYAFTVKLKK